MDASLLDRWRRQHLGGTVARPSFAPLVVRDEDETADAGSPAASPLPPPEPAAGMVEVELACGARLRVTGAADPAAIRAVVGALRGRRR